MASPSDETVSSPESENQPAPEATSQPAPEPAATPAAPEAGEPVPKKGGMGKMVAIVVLLLVVLGGGAYAAYTMYLKPKPKPAAAAHVKIGVLLAFSGGSSSMGYGAFKGVQLAKKQLGADNIDLIQADGQCDPKVAPKAMQYLIDQHVAAVIGENCSSASVAVLPLANKNHVLLLSPSASSPLLSTAGDFFFRTVPSDEGQGAFLAKSMYDAGIHKAAVFFTDEPYGSAIDTVFKTQFTALGGTVVASVSAPSSVIDVATQVAAIKASNPQGLAIVTNSTVSSTAVMKLARQTGVTAAFYGGDNLYDNTIITNNGAAAEGLHVVSFPVGDQAFKQALLNEYHVTEQLYAAPEAYDAFHAIYLAVQKGATTGDQFKTILPTISFQGVSAPIKFDKFGEIPYQTYKYDLLEVKDGAFTVVSQ